MRCFPLPLLRGKIPCPRLGYFQRRQMICHRYLMLHRFSWLQAPHPARRWKNYCHKSYCTTFSPYCFAMRCWYFRCYQNTRLRTCLSQAAHRRAGKGRFPPCWSGRPTRAILQGCYCSFPYKCSRSLCRLLRCHSPKSRLCQAVSSCLSPPQTPRWGAYTPPCKGRARY